MTSRNGEPWQACLLSAGPILEAIHRSTATTKAPLIMEVWSSTLPGKMGRSKVYKMERCMQAMHAIEEQRLLWSTRVSPCITERECLSYALSSPFWPPLLS